MPRHCPPRSFVLFAVVASLAVAYSGCKKCDDGSDPDANCRCADGSMANDCKTAEDMVIDDMNMAEAEEDVTVGELMDSGVKDTVVYADDAITVDFYGCARIGDTNDVVCAFDLVGAGYDWTVSFPSAANNNSAANNSAAIDDMGREFRATTASIAGEDFRDRTLVQDIRTEARVRFDGVHSGATAFSLLTVPFDAYATQTNPPPEELMFRDIPLD
jgi:hypothetical protein